MKAIRVKRVYDAWEASDGYRVLADRLWPRGMASENARVDEWAKDFAPSGSLRKGLHGGEIPWDLFMVEYRRELLENPGFAAWAASLRDRLEADNVTLLTAAQLQPRCHVDILKDALMAAVKE